MKHHSFDSSPLAWSSFPRKHATTDLSGVGRGVRLLTCIYVVFEFKNTHSNFVISQFKLSPEYASDFQSQRCKNTAACSKVVDYECL